MTKPKWIPCTERMPMPSESHDGYFWGWNENKPSRPATIVEAWERDGIPKGFCHEACGIYEITHWMRIDPPEAPLVSATPQYLALFIARPEGNSLEFEANFGGERQRMPINRGEQISFAECTGGPCTITYIAIVDTASGPVGSMIVEELYPATWVSIGTRLLITMRKKW